MKSLKPPYRDRHHQRRLLVVGALLFGSILQKTIPLAQAQTVSSTAVPVINQATFSYQESVRGPAFQGATPVLQLNVDFTRPSREQPQQIPPGKITGCTGEVLPDYTGFSVSLYDPQLGDPTGSSINNLTTLVATELPDTPGNNIPPGLAPNNQNSNPFTLTNTDQGAYVFLLDPNRGQIDQGRAYILMINPPAGSSYDQRRIRITIGARTGNQVAYTATSLDGKPIAIGDNRASITGTLTIQNPDQTGAALAVLNLNASICQTQEIQIIKTGDRVSAEPGDTLIYRLAIRNLASAPLNNFTITDNLPLGFDLINTSVKAEFNGTLLPVTVTQSGSTATFTIAQPIPSGRNNNQVLNLVYAVLTTPDSVRGTGQNSASVSAQRTDNNLTVRDGPATHRIRLQPGILSDCGTLIGRVFVDKNFDGEQQPGEPGIPNAVIYMDDGNRIVTDANGLFSVANVIAGRRTAALDLSSLPGYALAPNLYFIERNSQSRLISLEPGGLARVNFGVTPAFQEGGKP